MAHRTIRLETIIENIALQQTGKTKHEFANFDEMIKVAIPFIFEDYPIFDEAYREELNLKILRHYYFREIVTVPWQRWKFYLANDMKIKMNYFNQLYESSLLAFDIFEDMNITETLDRDLSGEQLHTNTKAETIADINDETRTRNIDGTETNNETQTGNATSESNKVFEDTPYSQLGTTDYATDVTKETDSNDSTVGIIGSKGTVESIADVNLRNKNVSSNLTSDNTSNTVNSEDYIKTIVGNSGKKNKADLLVAFRKTFINVDEQVIKSLNDNFSGYYN